MKVKILPYRHCQVRYYFLIGKGLKHVAKDSKLFYEV